MVHKYQLGWKHFKEKEALSNKERNGEEKEDARSEEYPLGAVLEPYDIRGER